MQRKKEEDQADRADHAGGRESRDLRRGEGERKGKEGKAAGTGERREGRAETERKRVETGVETGNEYKRQGLTARGSLASEQSP